MKKIYIILAILVLLTQGCNDFLEPESQDKVVPKTVSHLRELLLGEIIQNKKDYTEYLSVMTDDFADQDGNQYEYRNQLWGYYTWQREPEEDEIWRRGMTRHGANYIMPFSPAISSLIKHLPCTARMKKRINYWQRLISCGPKLISS